MMRYLLLGAGIGLSWLLAGTGMALCLSRAAARAERIARALGSSPAGATDDRPGERQPLTTARS